MITSSPVAGRCILFRLIKSGDAPKTQAATRQGIPTLFAAEFDVQEIGDVFLDMSSWGKGIVFVNGHHLGRYWNVGPQQTLYLPGCWLRKGKNEIVVFEQQNDKPYGVIKTVKEPILDSLAVEP